jgi:hypothetical protein
MPRKLDPDERRRYEAQKAEWARTSADFAAMYERLKERGGKRTSGATAGDASFAVSYRSGERPRRLSGSEPLRAPNETKHGLSGRAGRRAAASSVAPIALLWAAPCVLASHRPSHPVSAWSFR